MVKRASRAVGLAALLLVAVGCPPPPGDDAAAVRPGSDVGNPGAADGPGTVLDEDDPIIPDLNRIPPEIGERIIRECRDATTGQVNVACVVAVLESDSDCDGYTFVEEVERGLDPYDPRDGPDRDCDGIPNEIDLDVDGDGIPNEFDNDIDGDGIVNERDSDTDGDGFLDIEDVDIDGDGLVNRWDIDKDADGESDPEDEDDPEDEPCECEQDDVATDSATTDNSAADDGSGASGGDNAAAKRKHGLRMQDNSDEGSTSGVTAAAQEDDDCDDEDCSKEPTEEQRNTAVRQVADRLSLSAEEVDDLLAALDALADEQSADAGEEESDVEALDEFIDQAEVAIADDPEDPGDNFEDQLDALLRLLEIDEDQPSVRRASNATAVLARQDTELSVRQQAEVVAAVAAVDDPVLDTIEEWTDVTLELIDAVEDQGVNAEQLPDAVGPVARVSGGLREPANLAELIGATATVARSGGISIARAAFLVERVASVLDEPRLGPLTDSATNIAIAARENSVDALEVLDVLDDVGADPSDGIDPAEADAAASFLAMQDD